MSFSLKWRDVAFFFIMAFPLCVFLACGAVALTQYKAQLKACDDQSLTASEDENCKTEVNKRWDEAGARPAAPIPDGGIQ